MSGGVLDSSAHPSRPGDARPLAVVGVPKEPVGTEARVAITPSLVPTLAKAGLRVLVERGAGAR